jgi:hypothetical protein
MEWISVEDRMPDVHYPKQILVVIKTANGSYVSIAGFFDDYKDEDIDFEQKAHFEVDVDMIDLPAEVTHWMPLPKPPEAKE